LAAKPISISFGIIGVDFLPPDQPQDRQPAAPAAHRRGDPRAAVFGGGIGDLDGHFAVPRYQNCASSGFPGAGLQSSVAGSAVNVQFMVKEVKDSKKYAATGGWGFADFTNGKPGDEALQKSCFPCHLPAKDRDFVFARYAPTP
jgi:hypothetical protein